MDVFYCVQDESQICVFRKCGLPVTCGKVSQCVKTVHPCFSWQAISVTFLLVHNVVERLALHKLLYDGQKLLHSLELQSTGVSDVPVQSTPAY